MEPLDVVLSRITEVAKRAVPGAAEVSVSLIDRDRASSAAYTGHLAIELDERQYELDHGPCLDAARTGKEFQIHDMASETRWPQYAIRAIDAGAHSSLSMPLLVRDRLLGALNIYAVEPKAFAESDAEIARTVARYAAVALHSAQVFAASAALAVQLSEAMASRAVIEQAKGILMGERRCTPEEAFDLLRKVSQESNRKLRDVAQALVERAAQGSTHRSSDLVRDDPHG